MHVLHLIDGLGLGGAERMLIDIANRTVADGHQASVCVTRSDVTLVDELDPRIERLILNRTSRVSPFALVRLARFIRMRKVDIVHVHLRSNLAFFLQLRALHGVTTPIVFHDHYGTIEIDRTTPWWFHLARRYVAEYVGVHVQLEDWAVAAGMPRAHVHTISNALDLERLVVTKPTDLRELLRLPSGTPIVVAVATLRPDKGIEMLLDAVALSRHRHEMHVAIIGADGPASYVAECHRRVTLHGLESTVSFLGGRTDVPSLLPLADVAVLPSHTESGPLVLIEYLAARLPIVSTRVGDIGRRLAASGVPGFVEPRDVAAFAAELDAVLELSPDDRHSRGARSASTMRAELDIRTAMPAWYEIYRSAATSNLSTASR